MLHFLVSLSDGIENKKKKVKNIFVRKKKVKGCIKITHLHITCKCGLKQNDLLFLRDLLMLGFVSHQVDVQGIVLQ